MAPSNVAAQVAPPEAEALNREIQTVLTHHYAGIDTTGLLGRIQERLQWTEKDQQLVEAEGILHFDQGDVHLALPCFRRLIKPSALTMGLMAEALMQTGDKYEASSWYLRAARAVAKADSSAPRLFRSYLAIKPEQPKVELELAERLEIQNRYSEALAIYLPREKELITDTAMVFRIIVMLSSQARDLEALSWLKKSTESNPRVKSLRKAMALEHEILDRKLEAAIDWSDAWRLDPSDSESRDRAFTQLESVGTPGDSLLQSILDHALEQDPASANLHFKYALLLLRKGARAGAYPHLEAALKTDPKNPTYLSRIPEAIEGDSLIKVHFAAMKALYEQNYITPRLAEFVARGYRLSGDKAGACKTWLQEMTRDAAGLKGNREAFLDLYSCPDPAAQTGAAVLGEKLADSSADREVLQAMLQLTLKSREFAKAANHARKLVEKFPENAATGLATAKILIAAGDEDGAREVLTAIVQKVPNPEASLLSGRILASHKDYLHALEQFALAAPTYPEAIKLRALCLEDKKDLADAAVQYSAHYAKTGDKESLRATARLYHQIGDAAKEREALEAMQSKGLAGEQERLYLGLAHLSLHDSAWAYTEFNDLLRGRAVIPTDRDWSVAALFLGMSLMKEGKTDRSIRTLAMGLKSAPENVPGRAEAFAVLASSYADKHLWKEASAAYAQAVARNPSSRELIRGQLEVARKLEDRPTLEWAYRAVYALDTTDAEANLFLAKSLQTNRDYKQAARHFRRLAEAHPSDPKAWENLGIALSMIPDLPAAAIPLQTAIDLGAESDEVYINRARAYRIEGAKDMAGSILAFLLARNSQDYLATLWSAKFAEEDGNQLVAVEFYKKASRLAVPHSVWPELAVQGFQEAKGPEAQ